MPRAWFECQRSRKIGYMDKRGAQGPMQAVPLRWRGVGGAGGQRLGRGRWQHILWGLLRCPPKHGREGQVRAEAPTLNTASFCPSGSVVLVRARVKGVWMPVSLLPSIWGRAGAKGLAPRPMRAAII